MPFLKLALRIYLVAAALPVLGFLIVLLVEISIANRKKRLEMQHEPDSLNQA